MESAEYVAFTPTQDPLISNTLRVLILKGLVALMDFLAALLKSKLCNNIKRKNVAKTFLTLIDKQFPKDKRLSKIFDRKHNESQLQLSTQR